MGEWIQEFKGRNDSLAVELNFLWKEENVYVMDNHRAALWCWLQHMDTRNKCGLFHIDAHYDFGAADHALKLDGRREPEGISFQEYLDLAFDGPSGEHVAVIRWDNYLTAFAALYPERISECFMATHGAGQEPPATFPWEEIRMADLPRSMGRLLTKDGTDGWIVNLDLDYFFYALEEGPQTQLQSEQYLLDVAAACRDAYQGGQIRCLTVCLSPECCGRGDSGWHKAESIAGRFLSVLDLEFELPQ